MKSVFQMAPKNFAVSAVIVVASFFAAACSPEQSAPAEPIASPVEVTMREIMTGVVTPATNAIWEGSYSPDLSEEDWQRLLEAAIQLSTAATAISLGGSDDVPGGRADMDDWQSWSRQLAERSLLAKAAAENRNQTAFADAGDPMVEICEACHIAYLPGAQ